MERLQEIIDTFRSVDDELRLQLLLDYADRLPPVPDRLRTGQQMDSHLVPECQTPVYLWVERENGRLDIYAEVAEESPTVKGFLSIVIDACSGQPPSIAAELPTDLLHRLGLAGLLRMTRAVGLSAVLGRIKREAAAQSQEAMEQTP